MALHKTSTLPTVLTLWPLISCFLFPNLGCLKESWTGEKIPDEQMKMEGQEQENKDEEVEENMTSRPGHSKHDPEDL